MGQHGMSKQLSHINLHDSESVWLNQEGRSLGYFCLKKPVNVNAELLAELKQISSDLGGKNIRLCLHENPDSAFHDMIILERKENYYRPHKHILKGESYHIIEGSQGVVVFDDSGLVIDSCKLEPGSNIIYRVGSDMYHTVIPLSDLVVYHESKPGPFLPSHDSVFPDWAPDGTDPAEVTMFVSNIMECFIKN